MKGDKGGKGMKRVFYWKIVFKLVWDHKFDCFNTAPLLLIIQIGGWSEMEVIVWAKSIALPVKVMHLESSDKNMLRAMHSMKPRALFLYNISHSHEYAFNMHAAQIVETLREERIDGDTLQSYDIEAMATGKII